MTGSPCCDGVEVSREKVRGAGGRDVDPVAGAEVVGERSREGGPYVVEGGREVAERRLPESVPQRLRRVLRVGGWRANPDGEWNRVSAFPSGLAGGRPRAACCRPRRPTCWARREKLGAGMSAARASSRIDMVTTSAGCSSMYAAARLSVGDSVGRTLVKRSWTRSNSSIASPFAGPGLAPSAERLPLDEAMPVPSADAAKINTTRGGVIEKSGQFHPGDSPHTSAERPSGPSPSAPVSRSVGRRGCRSTGRIRVRPGPTRWWGPEWVAPNAVFRFPVSW